MHNRSINSTHYKRNNIHLVVKKFDSKSLLEKLNKILMKQFQQNVTRLPTQNCTFSYTATTLWKTLFPPF